MEKADRAMSSILEPWVNLVGRSNEVTDLEQWENRVPRNDSDRIDSFRYHLSKGFTNCLRSLGKHEYADFYDQTLLRNENVHVSYAQKCVTECFEYKMIL